ncbi:MAG: hypothetical protein V2A76_17470 [Planctomycetota bacterium]
MKAPILLAALTLLGTSVLSAQQGERGSGERRAGGLPLFESDDAPGYPLRSAGRRTKTPLTNGNTRLEYVLTTRSEEPEGESSAMSFFERWLVGRLGDEFKKLESVELVDRTESRMRDGGKQTSSERALVLLGKQDVIWAAEQFLDQVIIANRAQVLIKGRLVSREADPGQDQETVEVLAMDKEACEQRKRSHREEDVEVLMSPNLLVLGGQSSQIMVGNQTSFLLRHEAQVVGELLLLNPVVDTVWDGVSIGVTPVIGPEGKRLYLMATIEIANLKRPLQTVDLSLPSSSGTAKIEVPEISTVDWSSDTLVLEEKECAIEIRGLRVTEWTEEGEKRRRDVSLLLEFDIQKQEEVEVPSVVLARVIGFDPSNSRAFAKHQPGYAPLESAGPRVILKRDGETVGTGFISESWGESPLIVIKVEEGEAREGDFVRFFAK